MNRLLFKLKRRLRALFRRAELVRELDAEVRFPSRERDRTERRAGAQI